MKGFLLRSRQVSPYVAGLLGRLQLPCPRLAGLIVSFSSVCLGSSGLLRVAGAVFWGSPKSLGSQPCLHSLVPLGNQALGPSSGTCGLIQVSARALEHPCSIFSAGQAFRY